MAVPIYKQFKPLRTAFCILALFIFVYGSSIAYAQNNPAYTIEGVEVDVTAKNAVLAREKALDEAQVKAYKMLAERLLTPEEVASLKVPDPITLSSLVQDFEVVKEQVSNVRYKGEYIFRFRPNAMKSKLAAEGKVYSDTIKKPILVLPIFHENGQNLLWEDSNPWMKAWKTLPADKNLMQPTILPLGDAQDISLIAGDEGLQFDPMAAQELATRYGADDIAILWASNNDVTNAKQGLVINLYKNGFEGPTFSQKFNIEKLQNETSDAMFLRAAMKVKSALRAPSKNTTQTPIQTSAPVSTVTTYNRPPLGVPTNYTATAKFLSVQDWVRLKSTLDKIYGMNAVMVKGLKPREATLDLRFSGDGNALIAALRNAGISMQGGGSKPLEIYMGSSVVPSNIYR